MVEWELSDQTTEPGEENHNEIPPKLYDDGADDSQKTPEENTPEIQSQNTPEPFENTQMQKEPMKTRGEKYNLRPNPKTKLF